MLEPTRSGERKSTLEPARFVYLYRDYGKQVFAVTCGKRNRALSIAMHSGALEPAISAVRVENESGQQVDRGDCHVGADNTSLLEVSLAPLPPGVYRVIWSVVSRDGHRTQGNYTFTIQTAR